jgi:hypothetical protein
MVTWLVFQQESECMINHHTKMADTSQPEEATQQQTMNPEQQQEMFPDLQPVMEVFHLRKYSRVIS